MDQVADQTVTLENWDELTDDQLDVLERKIATKYMRIVPWGAVAWGIGNTLLWLSLWPLVLLDILPLWLGFIIATFNCALAYLPSHEAQHSIIAAPASTHSTLIPIPSPAPLSFANITFPTITTGSSKAARYSMWTTTPQLVTAGISCTKAFCVGSPAQRAKKPIRRRWHEPSKAT